MAKQTEATLVPRAQAIVGSPPAVPMLIAVLVFIVLDFSEGGYPLTYWYPAGLFLLALLCASVFVLPGNGPSGSI